MDSLPSSDLPRFLVDRTLGRLGRWLRLLGYDAAWDSDSDAERLLTRAQSEGRMLLTRDTLLVQRRAVRRGQVKALLIRHNGVEDQLRQLGEELGLRRRSRARCLCCNTLLEMGDPEEARKRVPPYVAQTQSRFSYCPTCDRYTWAATHWENARRLLARAGLDDEPGLAAEGKANSPSC